MDTSPRLVMMELDGDIQKVEEDFQGEAVTVSVGNMSAALMR
jgi:hypothetical protein